MIGWLGMIIDDTLANAMLIGWVGRVGGALLEMHGGVVLTGPEHT